MEANVFMFSSFNRGLVDKLRDFIGALQQNLSNNYTSASLHSAFQ